MTKKIILAIIACVILFGLFKLYQSLQWHTRNNLSAREFITEKEINPDWMDERIEKQLAQSKTYEFFYDFQLSDKFPASGITFQHRINPDAAIDYKPVHYDHGNGLAIADVDNDGNYDIYFVSQVGIGELWRNKGDGTFTNITLSSGLGDIGDLTNISASFADIDNDGDADLLITAIRKGNILFENNGDGTFKNITAASGLTEKLHSSGAVFFDYDLDGLLDLLVCNVGKYTTDQLKKFKRDGKDYSYYVGFSDAFAGHLKPERFESSMLYRNMGRNKFKNVTIEVGLENNLWTGDATPIDVNEDGYQDLYLLNMQGEDKYYENVKGEKFVDKSSELFPNTSWGAMSIKSFDYNNDGKQDIFITDMHSDMGKNAAFGIDVESTKGGAPFPPDFLKTENGIYGNTFFEKNADNTFKEVSDQIGTENYWPWGLSVGDLNADGFEDIFIASSMNYPYRYAINSVMLNDNGKNYLPAEYLLGVEPRRDNRYAKPWFDLDCSGADKDHQHCKNKKGKTTIWGSLGSRSSVVFDLDNDGDLDVVTNELNDNPMVLINNLSDKKNINYLKVQLRGIKSNRDGLGAQVVVKTDKATYTKIHDGQSGYLSQSSYPLYFGLGDTKIPESIEVEWPSGKTQVIDVVEPDNENTIVIIED